MAIRDPGFYHSCRKIDEEVDPSVKYIPLKLLRMLRKTFVSGPIISFHFIRMHNRTIFIPRLAMFYLYRLVRVLNQLFDLWIKHFKLLKANRTVICKQYGTNHSAYRQNNATIYILRQQIDLHLRIK